MQQVLKERLNTAMLLAGVGTLELSRRSGINPRRVNELTQKGGLSRNSTIHKLARALNVSPTELISLKEAENDG